MLVWIDGTPQCDENNEESLKHVTEFFDKIISRSRDRPQAELQLHRHSRTCNKGRQACRFNFPQSPMKTTDILKTSSYMLDAELRKKNYKAIKKILDSMKYREDITFELFLERLHLQRRNICWQLDNQFFETNHT